MKKKKLSTTPPEDRCDEPDCRHEALYFADAGAQFCYVHAHQELTAGRWRGGFFNFRLSRPHDGRKEAA